MFTAITNFIADVKAGYVAMVDDASVACANAKADVANQVEVSHVNVSRTYTVVYSCAAVFYKLCAAVTNNSYVQKAIAWTYANDLNLNITTAVLSLPIMPVAFGLINAATVVAMVLSFVALTELFVPVSANLGLSAKTVRIIGYSAAVVKAAIVLGVGALFM